MIVRNPGAREYHICQDVPVVYVDYMTDDDTRQKVERMLQVNPNVVWFECDGEGNLTWEDY